MSIKSILREELENSVKMQTLYERQLEELPKGSIAKRKIHGRYYYYLVYRQDGVVKTDYLGKEVPEENRSLILVYSLESQ